MLYTNTIFINIINQYLEGSIDENTFVETLPKLQIDDELESPLLLSDVIEQISNPHQCIIVIRAILGHFRENQANLMSLNQDQHSEQPAVNLFESLLMTANNRNLSPFYQAFLHPHFEMIVPEIASWLKFGLTQGWIQKENYAIMLLQKTDQGNSFLCELAQNELFQRFELGLQALHFAYHNQLVSDTDFQNEIRHLQSTAFQFGGDESIKLLIQYFKENDCFIKLLVWNKRANCLNDTFEAINKSIQQGELANDFYKNLLLHTFVIQERKYRLLDLGFRDHDGHTAYVILKHAEKANENGWLSMPDYQDVLLGHPRIYMGFNNGHEAVLCNVATVYCYISTCLRAIINEQISLRAFMTSLTKYNKAGFTVFQQAINNKHIETAELFLNLFKQLASQETYYYALFPKEKPDNPINSKDITECRYHIASDMINNILGDEKKQQQQAWGNPYHTQSTTSKLSQYNINKYNSSIVFYRSEGRTFSVHFVRFLNLTAQINHKLSNQKTRQTDESTAYTPKHFKNECQINTSYPDENQHDYGF